MKNEMEQGSKRRTRKKQTRSYESTDLIESGKSLILDAAHQQQSAGRKPFKVAQERPSFHVIEDTVVRAEQQSQSAIRSGAVVANVPASTEVSKPTQWQDAHGKSHRIDGEHRLLQEPSPVTRTSPQEVRESDHEIGHASASESTLCANEPVSANQRHDQSTSQHPQQPILEQEHEAAFRSERLAITRERELLIQERELLIRERELLAADRRQLSLEFARHANREAPVERDSTQSATLSETISAVNRQFGTPVYGELAANIPCGEVRSAHHVVSTEPNTSSYEPDRCSEDDCTAPPEQLSREIGATAVPTLDIASIFGINRVELKTPDCGSQDDQVPSTAAEQRYFLDAQHRIDDQHCHSAQLFEPPTASSEESPPVSATSATITRIDSGTETIAAPPPDSDDRLGSIDESIDLLVARLLARSRTNMAEEPRKTVQFYSGPSGPTINPYSAVAEQIDQDSPSSSCTLAEPRHKQDKQAVRGNLQVFRQVAMASARTALARHSSQKMRGVMMTKGIILVLSLGAALLLLLEPFSAEPMDHWKGISCGLVAMLTALDIHRSWRKIRRPFRSNSSNAASRDDL